MAGMKRNINEIYNNNNQNKPNNGNNMSQNNGNIDNNNGNTGNNGNNNNGQNIQISNSNDAKKTRLDNNQTKQEPSRVVHLRNIPQQLTENEIIYLGLFFGNITNVLFLRSKNQTFLEFENITEAPNMIAHFAQSATQFSGKKIFVQYSNHQELNTDPNNSNNQHAQLALSEATSLHQSSKQGGKNTVLRATILNMIYPVTLDVLQQIFSKFGPVLKIITFTKNEKFQVLIQMKDGNAAQNARMSLNNQNIYNGCCTLQIDFSKLTTLEVRFNNDKSRDYTNLLLPTGQDGNNMLNSQNDQIGSNNNFSQNSLLGNQPNLFGGSVQGNNNGGQNNMQYSQSGSMMGNNNSQGNNQHSSMNQGYGQNNGQNNMQYSQNGSMMGNNGSIQGNNNQGQGTNSPVLLVSNLNEEFCTPEALFTLFGVYGDVLRVKILFNKKDSALINFSNCQQASTALMNLDRCKLWSKQVRVFPSKHLTVQMPKDGQPDSGLTKDFTNSPLHRFKKPGSKNFNNIFPPSQTLHLSNIPASMQEQELRDLFGSYGTVRNFKFFQKDRKMALIQMDTTDESITGLIAMHNYQLAENMHLRCTFSKATI